MACLVSLTKYGVSVESCKCDLSLNYTLTVTITSKTQSTYSTHTYKRIWLGKRRKKTRAVSQINHEQLQCLEVNIYVVFKRY